MDAVSPTRLRLFFLIHTTLFFTVYFSLPSTQRPWCWIALAVTAFVWAVVWLRGLPPELRSHEVRTTLPALAVLALSALSGVRDLVQAPWTEIFDTLLPFLLLAAATWLIAATSRRLIRPQLHG